MLVILLLVACPPERGHGTGDYKLLLAGSRLYVDGIIKGNAGICPFGRHPISRAEDNPGKLFFNSITGINELLLFIK